MIGIVCFAIILSSGSAACAIFGGMFRPDSSRSGSAAIAWGSTAADLTRRDEHGRLGESVANFGLSLPTSAVSTSFQALSFCGVILVTAIPFGIYDLVEAMDNVVERIGCRRQLPDDESSDCGRRSEPDWLPDG